MEAYTRISLPVNKLNVSSPEGDDNKWLTITFLELFNDDSELECLHIHKCMENKRNVLCLKRDSVPKVEGYVLNVVELMDDARHIDDFRTHFRVSRELFRCILSEVAHILYRNGHGPQVNVHPDKQLLVALWYLANTSSMREVAHVFGLSMSTVHGIVKDVCAALVQLGSKVLKSHR
jgi:hypothetical protein